MVVTYPFLIIACQNSFPGSSLRLHPRRRLATLWSLWIDLPPSWIRDVDRSWARVRPILNQVIEKALICIYRRTRFQQNAPIMSPRPGVLSLHYCYCDERTEERKHWHVRLKSERSCGLGISRKEN